jgi:hypothetical protein
MSVHVRERHLVVPAPYAAAERAWQIHLDRRTDRGLGDRVSTNMKTAKALGINMPQSILLRADRVID